MAGHQLNSTFQQDCIYTEENLHTDTQISAQFQKAHERALGVYSSLQHICSLFMLSQLYESSTFLRLPANYLQPLHCSYQPEDAARFFLVLCNAPPL